MSVIARAGGLVARSSSHPAKVVTVAVESARLQVRTEQHPLNWVQGVVQPASFLLIAAWAGRGRVDVESAALGAGLLALWGSTVWASGSILRRERWEGTLTHIIARPTGLGTVLVGKTLGATLRSSLLIALTIAVTAAAFGDPIDVQRPVLFIGAFLGVLASATALGMLLSCLFVLTRAAGRISEALMYPVFILGGMLVPLTLLPDWIRLLSWAVSLRWGGELLKAAAAGDATSRRAWLLLAITTALYAVLARFTFQRVLDRARRQGDLDTY
jgi:ABC-2 type transport system permease protein